MVMAPRLPACAVASRPLTALGPTAGASRPLRTRSGPLPALRPCRASAQQSADGVASPHPCKGAGVGVPLAPVAIDYDGDVRGFGLVLAAGGDRWFASVTGTFTDTSLSGDFNSSIETTATTAAAASPSHHPARCRSPNFGPWAQIAGLDKAGIGEAAGATVRGTPSTGAGGDEGCARTNVPVATSGASRCSS